MKCPKCGTELTTKLIYTPVWDGIFPCSGGGETVNTVRLWCPECQKVVEDLP